MLYSKDLKKKQVFKLGLSIYEILVFVVAIIISFFIFWKLTGSRVINSIFAISNFLVTAIFMIKLPRSKTRIYKLLWYKIVYLFSKKEYKASEKEMIFAYKEIRHNALVLKNNNKISVIAFNGKNIYNGDEIEIKSFLERLKNEIETINGRFEIVRLKEKTSYEQNCKFILDAATNNEKNIESNEVLQDYLIETQTNFLQLEDVSLIDKYYILLISNSFDTLYKDTQNITNAFNMLGMSATTLEKDELIEFVAKMHGYKISEKAKEYEENIYNQKTEKIHKETLKNKNLKEKLFLLVNSIIHIFYLRERKNEFLLAKKRFN
ncbi:hypothetical protein [Mycoplasma buteonis]|uniref:hypothetical protein n=1 Tax=Mycoplasma buteonis TaxID=171280 RepID=UPI00055B62A2|nr:hypothetical protein [Mycoplasma buteonis]